MVGKEVELKKALQEVNSVQKTVDLGDEQRRLMEHYEQELNDDDSTTRSPQASGLDFGFWIFHRTHILQYISTGLMSWNVEITQTLILKQNRRWYNPLYQQFNFSVMSVIQYDIT